MKRTCKNCTHFNWCKEVIGKSFKHTPCQDHEYNILRPIAIIVWIIIWLMIVISLHAEEVNPYYSEKQCLDIETYIEYNGKLTGLCVRV